jgi:uncharacterized protein (DUF1800 family)
MAENQASSPALRRLTTRRAVLGGSVAAASVAVAYAALGDKFDLFGGGSSGPAGSSSQAVQDTDAIAKESVRINHLLRRAGFGVTRDEYEHYQSLGLKGAIDELINFTAVDDSAAVNLAAQVPIDEQNRQNLPVWWMVRMANTRRPLQEKMTYFWHSLLTSQLSVVKDPALMLRQNEFFRTNAMSTFPQILKGISADPAMMLYLDISGSQRTAPNENYARELMELFSLGIGNYTENDIRQSARAFTGWVVQRTGGLPGTPTYGEPQFVPNRFDSGTKTFLGKTGNFRPDDIVDIIVEQPASAKFIVSRLFSFFAYPGASDKTLQTFMDTYLKSNKSIGATVEAILRSDEMYSPQAYRAIVRSPVEYIIAAIKALGSQAAAAQIIGQVQRSGQLLNTMGQVLFEPPNVAGWPGGQTWLNSATMFARLNFINLVTGGAAAPRGNQRAAPVPQQPAGANLGTAAQALDYYLPMVLDGNIPDQARQVLFDYVGGADAQLSPDQLRSLVYLILASPQFHLA